MNKNRTGLYMPDFRSTAELLADGISSDLNGDYLDVRQVYFDIVVKMSANGNYEAIILDNRYKLSKAILDTDEGREAVIIPMDVGCLKLKKYRGMDFNKRRCLIKKEIMMKLFRHRRIKTVDSYIKRNSRKISKLKELTL